MDVGTLSAVVSIVLIDLVLSGDNALVIGMAARSLPGQQRRWAIIGGTLAAIALRVSFALALFYLLFGKLSIPGIRLVGGLLLTWIAFRLLTQPASSDEVSPGQGLIEAIRIIVVADVVMSLDNILAVAGASQGHLWALVFGLVLSIPILMAGATVVARLLSRFPWLTWLGGAVIAWVAGQMIVDDPLLHERLGELLTTLHWIIPLAMTLGIVVAAFLRVRYRGNRSAAPSSASTAADENTRSQSP